MADADGQVADLKEAAGNALEVVEIMETLTNPRTSRLTDITLALGAELLVLAGVEADVGKAAGKLLETLHLGQATERFDRERRPLDA